MQNMRVRQAIWAKPGEDDDDVVEKYTRQQKKVYSELVDSISTHTWISPIAVHLRLLLVV